jgi:hypothetical protein
MPTISDVKPLHQLLGDLRPGESVHHGALSVVPLLWESVSEPDWLTLPEAGEAFTIEEVSEAGRVQTLRVTNGGNRPVLLIDGEELIGAKQNRVLNTTVLVAARSRLDIPVSCVEQGRWAYRARHFSSSDASLYASVRAKKAARISASLRSAGQHLGDQGQIWEDVASKAAKYRVESPTGAMRDVYDRYGRELAAGREALTARAGQVGAVVFLDGRWIGIDVLTSPRLFERVWRRLCVGYVAETIGRERSDAKSPDATELLERLGRAPVEEASAVGLGREHRIAGDTMTGAALLVEGVVAHFMAFPVAE